MENAVGFLRRNLLVPEPVVSSVAELNRMLRDGCDEINAGSHDRNGIPTPEAFREDLAAMLALPGTPFDAVRWVRAKADKRGYACVDGDEYCAGPAWHDRELVVGMRSDSVEILADRGRHVTSLPRAWGDGEVVRNPASLIPALVARPRAFGESTIRKDMPVELVAAIDRCGRPERRQALRAISRATDVADFASACEAARRIFASGRVPDDESCDLLARRVAGGAPERGGPDLRVYDGFLGRGDEADAW